jgi:purine nucleosidase
MSESGTTTGVRRQPVIIDTDGGVDDAAGLWWALTDPGIELIGVTSVAGMISAPAAAANVLRILAAAGRTEIPVAVGADARVGPAPAMRPADFIHGADGLGNTHRPPASGVRVLDATAIELLDALCRQRHGEVSLVSLGPLTNLANAIAQFPDWPQSVRQLIAMAGSATAGGNALPAAEANVAHDPVAAARVVAARWRQPPLMIGLDVTHAATLTDREFALLAERRTPAAAFLDEPLHFYREFGSTFTAPDCPCHDLLAVMAVTDEELITDAPLLPLAIDTSGGPAWGATVVDFRAPFFERLFGAAQQRPEGFFPWRIALRTNVARFRSQVRRMFGDA